MAEKKKPESGDWTGKQIAIAGGLAAAGAGTFAAGVMLTQGTQTNVTPQAIIAEKNDVKESKKALIEMLQALREDINIANRASLAVATSHDDKNADRDLAAWKEDMLKWSNLRSSTEKLLASLQADRKIPREVVKEFTEKLQIRLDHNIALKPNIDQKRAYWQKLLETKPLFKGMAEERLTWLEKTEDSYRRISVAAPHILRELSREEKGIHR